MNNNVANHLIDTINKNNVKVKEVYLVYVLNSNYNVKTTSYKIFDDQKLAYAYIEDVYEQRKPGYTYHMVELELNSISARPIWCTI